jgi:hypothetical protein
VSGDDQRGALFRPIVPNQHSRVTYAELFFDLVFVFAVTQLSHALDPDFDHHDHRRGLGIGFPQNNRFGDGQSAALRT